MGRPARSRRGIILRTPVALLLAALTIAAVDGVARAQGILPDAVLRKIKHATVQVKVKLASGTDVEATGWFVEPGLIVTNAHVVGLEGQDAKMPRSMEAVIDSGEAGSRKLAATFVGGDIDADLAVLRVAGDDLPEPLAIGPTSDLVETQDVLIFGFPFGKQIGKAITVGRSSITSLRKSEGELNEIQVNGGINPGNSGGPIVNLKGEVIGIAVSGITGSTVNMAIPADKLTRLLGGRVVRLSTQSAILEDGQIRIPVRITILDPLQRLTNLQLEHWVGAASKSPWRPGGESLPEPVAGDGDIEAIDFSFDSKSVYAFCDVPVPALTDNTQCHWLRVAYVDGQGKARWTSSLGNIRPVPAERREIELVFKPQAGPGTPMQLVNDSTFKVQMGKSTDTRSMHIKVFTKPTFLATSGPEGDIAARCGFTNVLLGVKVNGELVNVKDKWGPIATTFLKTTALIEYAENGFVVNSQVDMSKTDPDMRRPMQAIGDHLLQSVELLSVPLPDGPLRPLDRLRAQRNVLIGVPGAFVPALADVRYQYLGVRRVADGDQTAVFELSGSLRPRRGDNTKAGGRLTGGVDLLLSTGEVHSAVANMLVDMELAESEQIRLQGSLAIDYRRAPPELKRAALPDAKPVPEPARRDKPAAEPSEPAPSAEPPEGS